MHCDRSCNHFDFPLKSILLNYLLAEGLPLVQQKEAHYGEDSDEIEDSY